MTIAYAYAYTEYPCVPPQQTRSHLNQHPLVGHSSVWHGFKCTQYELFLHINKYASTSSVTKSVHQHVFTVIHTSVLLRSDYRSPCSHLYCSVPPLLSSPLWIAHHFDGWPHLSRHWSDVAGGQYKSQSACNILEYSTTPDKIAN